MCNFTPDGVAAQLPSLLVLSYKVHRLSQNANALVNPVKPNGFSYSYQLDQSVSVLRVVGQYF